MHESDHLIIELGGESMVDVSENQMADLYLNLVKYADRRIIHV